MLPGGPGRRGGQGLQQVAEHARRVGGIDDVVEGEAGGVAQPGVLLLQLGGSPGPDLGPLLAATRTVGSVLAPGAVVVYESTVYPGVTEEQCGALLAETSGLVQSRDFKLGYSPERINPGDKLHTFDKIVKVVSGEEAETLDMPATMYDLLASLRS